MNTDDVNRARGLQHQRFILAAGYAQTEAAENLEQALQLARQIVDRTTLDHPYLARRLNSLGNLLGDMYLKFGRIHDLEEAIQVGRKAVDMTGKDHPNRAMYLNDLGAVLGDRYERTGDITNLDESILLTEEAVSLTLADHSAHAAYLGNLGARFHNRYQTTRAISDLEDAIRLAKQSVQANPHKTVQSLRLHNLSRYLGTKYSRTMNFCELEESIQVGRQAIELITTDDPYWTLFVNNLGVQVEKRYLKTKNWVDLEETIEIQKAVVTATPQEHSDRPGLLCNLGRRLERKYCETGEAIDLEESIRLKREALEACPEGHVQYAAILKDLGAGLMKKVRRTRKKANLQEACVYLRNALQHINAPIITRIQAGHALLLACTIISDWQQAYDASDAAVRLIPRLTSRSLENHDRHHVLRQIVGFASDAAAVALQAGKGASIALSFLEQGRGLLALSIDNMRTDVVSLREKHPVLADQFVRLRDQLECESIPVAGLNAGELPSRWRNHGSHRYNAGNKLEGVIAEIRRQPGFEAFMAIPTVDKMQASAVAGPIVVVNVSKFRCDALVVDKTRIWSLLLPQLHNREIKKKASSNNLGTPVALEWLWDVVASPILDYLGFVNPSSSRVWPHVWWVNTGLLTKFPIHAAGYHNDHSGRTVLDRVISSYTISLKTLLHNRQRHNPQVTSSSQAQALLVAMEHTPGHTYRLPFATKEVAMLRDICKSIAINSVEPVPRRENIISSLPECNIFHFAGHGHANEQDPLQSYLIVGREQEERLTVADFLRINLHDSLPFLAYLSACGTGRIKDNRSVDEGVQLTSACQLAGFRHVIGTLWEVNDEMCLDVARDTYDAIREKGMTDDSVCWGLHRAITNLRNSWLAKTELANRGERSVKELRTSVEKLHLALTNSNDGTYGHRGPSRDAVLLADEEDQDAAGILQETPLWVAYVHFGI